MEENCLMFRAYWDYNEKENGNYYLGLRVKTCEHSRIFNELHNGSTSGHMIGCQNGGVFWVPLTIRPQIPEHGAEFS